MLDPVETGKQPESEYYFGWKHPDSGNGCSNIGNIVEKPVKGINYDSAKAIAENTVKIVCPNPSCRVDYQLQE